MLLLNLGTFLRNEMQVEPVPLCKNEWFTAFPHQTTNIRPPPPLRHDDDHGGQRNDAA